jgi:hypothetical protein
VFICANLLLEVCAGRIAAGARSASCTLAANIACVDEDVAAQCEALGRHLLATAASQKAFVAALAVGSGQQSTGDAIAHIVDAGAVRESDQWTLFRAARDRPELALVAREMADVDDRLREKRSGRCPSPYEF